MTEIELVERDINRAKAKLMRQKMRENFGQKEQRAIMDKYAAHQFKNNGVWDRILAFHDWCANYTGGRR